MKLAAMQKIEQFVLGQRGVRCPPNPCAQIDQSSQSGLGPARITGASEDLRVAYTLPAGLLGAGQGFWLQPVTPKEAANAYTAPTPASRNVRRRTAVEPPSLEP
jgi:hypothetical protein